MKEREEVKNMLYKCVYMHVVQGLYIDNEHNVGLFMHLYHNFVIMCSEFVIKMDGLKMSDMSYYFKYFVISLGI